jgi:glycosyltransferase involved in cell wall biosynthesis
MDRTTDRACPLALSIVVPVYNEGPLLAATVPDLLSRAAAVAPSFELILSENGSTDGSAALVDRRAANSAEIVVLHTRRADYGHALRRGFSVARGSTLVNFSVDLIDWAFLQQGLHLLDSHDIIVGSKYLRRDYDRRPWLRRRLGEGFNGLVGRVLTLPVRDSHGIKVYRRERIAELIERCRSGGALFDSELLYRAHRSGLRLCEIPLRVEEVRPTRTKIVRTAIWSLVALVGLRVRLAWEGTR